MYEALLAEAFKEEVLVQEICLSKNTKGLYGENVIWINKNLASEIEKKCILAEELGHHHTTVGDITDLSSILNQKQERIARGWAINKLVTLENLVGAYINNCYSSHEIAEYLHVTESFLDMTISYYRQKHGTTVRVNDKYILSLEPLKVYEELK